ncbi:MAG: iron ABC transporter permease [Alphaproteobacteria bacterium]|nr:iron ABC transporter permease [Alphaproteobacteria bacterium]
MAEAKARAGADPGERIILILLVVFAAFVAILPVARLLIAGLAPSGALDLSVMSEAWSRAATQRALWRTLVTALGGTAISLVLGAGFALVVTLTDVRAKTALIFGFMLPLMIAPQVTALAWIQAMGPASALLHLLGLQPAAGTPHPLYGAGGIILVLGLHHAPLVFLAMRAGLRSLPRELVEAASASGASPLFVVRSVVLPLMGPALTAGAGLAFVSSIGNFGIPAFLGIPAGYTVLVTLIYQRLSGFGPRVLPEVAAIAIVLALLAAIGLLAQLRRLRRDDARTSTLSAAASGWALGRYRLLVEAALWSFLGLVVAVPLLALIATSLVKAHGVPLSAETATLTHYAYVLFEHGATRRAFANSFILAGLAALILMVIAVPLAVLADWRRSRVANALSVVAEFPYALPGVVLAIGIILAFLRPVPVLGISLYNTAWIILLAYLARFLTLAWRPVAAGLAQIDRGLDEAAQAAGAGFAFRLRTIAYPLLAPAMAAGGIIVFLTAFNELTVSALLWSSGRETLGVVVFSLEQAGESTAAAAVAVMTVAATLSLMLVGSVLANRLPPGVLPWRA